MAKAIDLHQYGHTTHMPQGTIDKLQRVWDDTIHFGVHRDDDGSLKYYLSRRENGETREYHVPCDTVEDCIDKAHKFVTTS